MFFISLSSLCIVKFFKFFIKKKKFAGCTRCVIMCYLPSGDINVLVLCLQPLHHQNVCL
ncbi:hypothetical protein AB205_0197840 [Aquarana catesbeiana]|uniref:Uncharacterized protein n=1 Tax=Aquarana catesbeiana TaxID=8400 RepID=A0A2G9Q3P6_AQUCT|nr:hypothetical protein AB205_0197840 [Aquarana catesbeiana]